LQTTIWKEATALIDKHSDVLQRAMAHRWYANAAYMADMPMLAIDEFKKASRLLSQAPQTAATTRDYLDAEVWLAVLETRQGDLDRAASRLRKIEPTLAAAPSFVPEIRFADARAEISMKRADSVGTESALKVAVYLAEWALKSFPSETDRTRWARETQNTYRDMVEWKLRQGDATGALELWEWYKGAELRAGTYGEPSRYPAEGLDSNALPDLANLPPLPAPTNVQNQLAALHDVTVIAYAALRDGIVIWSYDDRGVFSEWVPTALPPVRDLALRFIRLCSDPHSDIDTVRASARTLYDLLLAPIQDRLAAGRTLLFEPDGFLEDMPWEALVDSKSRYLVESSPVIVVPGLYRMSVLRPATSIRPDSHALVVSVASAPGLRFLTDVEEEARSVASRFRSARWLSGNDANLIAIRQEIGSATVFHFAGHAVFSTASSGLALGELDPRTQEARLLNADSLSPELIDHLQLAVLSACGTGNEYQAGTSGTEGLARALLNSGTRHVVAARWNVDSTQTAQFMKPFYDDLLAGKSIANSMRSAQLALASRSVSAHPYYWSVFELEGAE
jgi:CHAT domain-containing protein